MANIKISQLPLATSPLDSTVEMPVVQGGTTKRAPVNTIGFLQSGAGAVERTVQAKLQETISVADYDTLTNAIASAKVSGRATTILINGTINVASTIVVDAPNITLQGAGGDTAHDIGTQGAGARAVLNWTGSAGGTVLRFASPTGASNQACTGGGVRDLYFGCNNSAAIGLQVLSWRKAIFERLHFDNPTAWGIEASVVATLGESRDVQNCEFRNLSSRHLEVTGGTGGLLRMDGDATANFSLNILEQLDCQFINGNAFQFDNTDNNYMFRCRAFRGPGGTGNALVFNGSNTAADQVARGNIVIHLSTNGAIPIICRGTTTFTHPSFNNSILMLDHDNTFAIPTIETGASAIWSDTRGILVNHKYLGVAAGDNITNALAASTRLGTSSLHLVNASEDHIRFSDAAGTNVWGLNIDASGTLRFVRVAGSGNLNLPSTTAFNGGLVTTGAADSGGAGFRVLRVPN